MKVRKLELQDCRDVLDKEIIIGTNEWRKITFNAYANEFTVWINEIEHFRTNAINAIEAINLYNEL